MSHTAEQARELWCPMVRIARREVITPAEIKHTGVGEFFAETPETLAIVGGCNTDALGGLRVPKSCRCIANQCAMWRWRPNHGEHMADKRKGYCGLAPIYNTTT